MAWQRSPEVVFEVVDGHAVLVDPAGTELLTLNPVGTTVWSALDGRRDAEELAADVAARFGLVDVSTIAHDITRFLAELEASGLVVSADAG